MSNNDVKNGEIIEGRKAEFALEHIDRQSPTCTLTIALKTPKKSAFDFIYIYIYTHITIYK